MPATDLYGGAMVCEVPTGLDDVSQFRQVPDNQEVFADATTGMCLVIELMSRQHSVSNDECGHFFFSDLGQSNGSSESIVTVLQQPLNPDQAPLMACASGGPASDYACIIGGTQRVSKYTNEAGRENEVFVAMAIFRLPSPISTDVLVSVTAPQRIAPGSSEERAVSRIATPDDVAQVLEGVTSTLLVRDWALFVPE